MPKSAIKLIVEKLAATENQKEQKDLVAKLIETYKAERDKELAKAGKEEGVEAAEKPKRKRAPPKTRNVPCFNCGGVPPEEQNA